ncbi:uncharacterized protein L969DRAFT_42366 [Mixia osmundae IAM 14324]|uniref:HMG box domain-containing protein n=1 Tax=Mixia osmundae (strain CBS 9802 / IAM 14324 / JCM 22182 / KY 12970) TaxID=764103 RepID=G7E363_MIXOS|nr:uncharacterized protein L969DRAFT_42366 [Mixia osmundae IAM 14324]KEI42467.1 hypothetical protein L969DRAFT_42366 [Mixia osmundae IAM 14324]GAA97244.1 hypothetical protein E5Q_03921 [Mixia osmundae IAM 14324]
MLKRANIEELAGTSGRQNHQAAVPGMSASVAGFEDIRWQRAHQALANARAAQLASDEERLVLPFVSGALSDQAGVEVSSASAATMLEGRNSISLSPTDTTMTHRSTGLTTPSLDGSRSEASTASSKQRAQEASFPADLLHPSQRPIWDAIIGLTEQKDKQDGLPPRPLNSFLLFSRYERPKLNREYPGVKTAELSKHLSQRWRSLSEHEREVYTVAAKQNKERFKEDNPTYQYVRRKSSNAKRKISPSEPYGAVRKSAATKSVPPTTQHRQGISDVEPIPGTLSAPPPPHAMQYRTYSYSAAPQSELSEAMPAMHPTPVPQFRGRPELQTSTLHMHNPSLPPANAPFISDIRTSAYPSSDYSMYDQSDWHRATQQLQQPHIQPILTPQQTAPPCPDITGQSAEYEVSLPQSSLLSAPFLGRPSPGPYGQHYQMPRMITRDRPEQNPHQAGADNAWAHSRAYPMPSSSANHSGELPAAYGSHFQQPSPQYPPGYPSVHGSQSGFRY